MSDAIHRKETPLEKIGRISGLFAERYVPDPWIYAILLTGVAYFSACIFTDAGLWKSAEAWHVGLWNKGILVLIAQFSLNLILCTAIARTPLLKKGLAALAHTPNSAKMAIALIGAVSIGLSLVSWALCIIGGAIFAQEVARGAHHKGFKLHYPLAIASGYIGMMTFGLGLTSSAPLIVSSPGHDLESVIGIVAFSETVGTPMSLTVLALLWIVCPACLAAMHPSQDIVVAPDNVLKETSSSGGDEQPAATFSEKLERSPWVLKIGAILPVSFLVTYYFIDGKGISINSMNLIFLCAALILYRTPRHMLDELSQASAGVWSIVFQFPFYAGLIGIIKGTGLGMVVAEAFVAISSEVTWPLIGAFFSALCNLFVPSAGGQWLVTGEILVQTSQSFNYSPAQAVMIEVMGDQVTNMIQPMWALPALALSGLEARHIMGYTAVVMVVGFALMCVGITFFPV
ncbi:MAG: hypothetical protein CMH56_04935 [Myxococcales bacterium]|nr:hypothetical protein [Myxococcales bacterium]